VHWVGLLGRCGLLRGVGAVHRVGLPGRSGPLRGTGKHSGCST
jgi:hypothetical protein